MTRSTCPGWVRALVRSRTKGMCDLCGQRMEAMDAHRRKQGALRGRYTPANVVGCHRRCHDKIHREIGWAMSQGLILRSTDRPDQLPVHLYDGWYHLDEHGAMTATDAPTGGRL